MSLPVIRRREFGAKRERPWWDSKPQPLNGFSYPCLEVQVIMKRLEGVEILPDYKIFEYCHLKSSSKGLTK